MIFSKMQANAELLLNKIYQLPFNQELAKGTLPNEKFIFYLTQDSLYLAEFSRSLALTAARLNHSHQIQQFIAFSGAAITAERQLHGKYINKNISSIEPSPTCFAYVNYLLRTVSTASIEEAVACLLPCFWIYQEVGTYIANLCDYSSNPYREWIQLYSSKEFASSVEAAISITNELGFDSSITVQNKMIAAFMRSTQFEWLFWDSAYHIEKWKV